MLASFNGSATVGGDTSMTPLGKALAALALIQKQASSTTTEIIEQAFFISTLKIIAGVDTTGSTGFTNNQLAQQRQPRFKSNPYPAREILAGGVFQPLDLVQIVMIELVEDRFKCLADIAKILHPSLGCADLTGDMYLDVERVPVQTRAFMGLGQVRQSMCSLDGKNLEYVHVSQPQ